MTPPTDADIGRILAHLQKQRGEMIDLLQQLVLLESSSDDAPALSRLLGILAAELRSSALAVRHFAGRSSGGFLYARQALTLGRRPFQLLIGHCDTVWPTGTLRTMPLRSEGDELYGPGAFDMKAGLVQMIYALRTLNELRLAPAAPCRVVINSDEEVGSPDSTPLIRRLAQRTARAFILEPAFGKDGKLKTARKAVGHFTLTIHGRAAHAGVSPEEGASAILELSHQVQRLFGLNDAERGITVNVGTIAGGTRANVIAAEVRAHIDVRVRTLTDAQAVEAALRSLTPATPNTSLRIEGGFDHPPMEPTERNQALWWLARGAGQCLGLELEAAAVGGASDGNTTSQYTATLDGLGAVGDGAHAAHEQVDLAHLVERTALLVLLLMAPLAGGGSLPAGGPS